MKKYFKAFQYLCLMTIFPIFYHIAQYKFKRYKKTEQYLLDKMTPTKKQKDYYDFVSPLYRKNIHRWHNLLRWWWNTRYDIKISIKNRSWNFKEYREGNPVDWILNNGP